MEGKEIREDRGKGGGSILAWDFPKSHRQRSPAGYSPQSHKELVKTEMTEHGIWHVSSMNVLLCLTFTSIESSSF